MLPLETIIAFTSASLLLACVPGPDNIFVLTQSSVYGWRTGMAVTLGLCVGLLVHTAAVALGVAVIQQRLAANLRRLRHESGWSQEEFADRAGIHRTYVSDLERGARNPTLMVVDRLAKALEVSAGSLLD